MGVEVIWKKCLGLLSQPTHQGETYERWAWAPNSTEAGERMPDAIRL